MTGDDIARLKRLLAAFDEPGLVALANKGLVRRAQKDLEAGGVSCEETETAVLVRGPGWTVTMPPDGPTKATDSTRATGVTRQILMATLYLRDHWRNTEPQAEPPTLPVTVDASAGSPPPAPPPPAPAPADAEPEELQAAVLAVSVEELQQWAGKPAVREALALVRTNPAIDVEARAGLTLRLVGHGVEVRVLPGRRPKSVGKFLDGILTTAPRSQRERWVAAAVLAFRQGRGLTVELPEKAGLAEPDGAPLTRRQLLTSAADVMTGMVTTGLAHPSGRTVERLFTLSISAGAVNLPRLARILRSLSDDVSQVVGRTAAADADRLFGRLCEAHALTRGLSAAQPPAGLVGQHRTQYDPIGDLHLTGVAAYPWQTASGFEGVTGLFWDQAADRFLTYTSSRPTGTAGRFELDSAYRLEGVWNGGSIERLSKSRFTLRQARANPDGRLSGSQQSAVADLTPAAPDELSFAGREFASWAALRAYARGTYPIGLAEKNPLDRVVVLRPAHWGDRVFDDLQQEFCWRLHDAEGRPITLRLPWNGVNESAVEFAESVNPGRDRLVAAVVRLSFGGAGLLVEPLSLLSAGTPHGHRVLNPGFDARLIVSRHSHFLERLREKYGRDRVPTTMTTDDEADAEAEGPADGGLMPPGIRAWLSELDAVLLRLAETGARRLDDPTRDRLRQLAGGLERLGLDDLRRAGEELAETEQPADALLRCGYLGRLHHQVIAAELATGAG